MLCACFSVCGEIFHQSDTASAFSLMCASPSQALVAPCFDLFHGTQEQRTARLFRKYMPLYGKPGARVCARLLLLENLKNSPFGRQCFLTPCCPRPRRSRATVETQLNKLGVQSLQTHSPLCLSVVRVERREIICSHAASWPFWPQIHPFSPPNLVHVHHKSRIL